MVREVETSEPTGFLIKSITTNLLIKCRSGVMVATDALGASAFSVGVRVPSSVQNIVMQV